MSHLPVKINFHDTYGIYIIVLVWFDPVVEIDKFLRYKITSNTQNTVAHFNSWKMINYI